MQTIETDQDAFVHLGVDPGRATFRPQIGQPLASERLDHDAV
jgi:hypothetical protein